MDVTDDPDAFARCLVTLLTDARAWEERRAAIARLLAAWQEESSGTPWSDVMSQVLARRPFVRRSLLV